MVRPCPPVSDGTLAGALRKRMPACSVSSLDSWGIAGPGETYELAGTSHDLHSIFGDVLAGCSDPRAAPKPNGRAISLWVRLAGTTAEAGPAARRGARL